MYEDEKHGIEHERGSGCDYAELYCDELDECDTTFPVLGSFLYMKDLLTWENAAIDRFLMYDNRCRHPKFDRVQCSECLEVGLEELVGWALLFFEPEL